MSHRSLTGRRDAPVVLTCEHATERLPAGWVWPEADERLLGTHWSHDLGVADLTEALAARTNWPATLAGFSRLLIDPNRGPDQPNLFRTHADGQPVALNAGLTEPERSLRMALHRDYHAACDAMVAAAPWALVFSLHSFTPSYEGERREMEVGVLFNHWEPPAIRLAAHLSSAGWRVALNRPWSGREGLMYAADRHSEAHGRVALELEVRQDLLADADQRNRLVGDLVAHFEPS